MVTLDHVKAFAQNCGGSLSGAVEKLGSMKGMPKHLSALDSADNTRPNSVFSPGLSPTERRQSKLRLYGIADKA
jgi:hypothetical protein